MKKIENFRREELQSNEAKKSIVGGNVEDSFEDPVIYQCYYKHNVTGDILIATYSSRNGGMNCPWVPGYHSIKKP